MDTLPIDSTLIIACPSCAMDNPVFLALSMLAGVVPCTYWLLKPYTHNVRTWGVPKIDASRLVSLVLMLSSLIPLGLMGRRAHPPALVATCVGLLAIAAIYFWLRACWLLDENHVPGWFKPLIFPGLLAPVLIIFGTIMGAWLMGSLLVAPAWGFEFFIVHTVLSWMMAAPFGLMLRFGLKSIFRQQKSRTNPPVDQPESTTLTN